MAEVKPYALRSIYRELTNDASGYHTSEEGDIDERVKEAEDLDVIIDLREMKEGRVAKFDIFWEKCAEYNTSLSVQQYQSDVTVKCASWLRQFQYEILSTRCLNDALPGHPSLLNLG